MTTGLIDIWINCPDRTVADTIALALLEARLVACANILPEIRSRYHWKGQVESEAEVPLLVKTRADLFDEVCIRVVKLHPYETPSIVGLPIEHVNSEYLEWVCEETRSR